MRESKAVSTLLLILLLLCSAIFGGLVSYLWVMSSYYNMPEDSTLLIVENVDFSQTDFTHFNVTVLNPSNSVSDANITLLLLRIETTNEVYFINESEPEIGNGFLLKKGTRQTFKCIENWSNFTGEVVRIEPIAVNASTRSSPLATPYAKLVITPDFDPYASVQYFNLTVENSAESVTNLTVSELQISGEAMNVTPTLPLALSPGQTQPFQCYQNWENLRGQNVTVTVKTQEGYETTNETQGILGAAPYVGDVEFDYADTTYFNITIRNSEDATIPAIISGADVVFQNGTVYPLSVRPPPILNTASSSISPNKSITFICNWNWTQYRNEEITVRAYSMGDFTVSNMTTTTPPSIVWNMTSVSFDLDDLGHFLVDVANTPCSLGGVNITTIELDDQNTTLQPPFAFLAPDEHATFSCAINWTNLIGQSINVTVFTADGTSVSTVVTIPLAQLKLLGDSVRAHIFGKLQGTTINTTTPYVNVTVSNSMNSLLNVTISRIVLEAGNVTQDLAESILYPKVTSGIYGVNAGESVTFVCYSDYTKYLTSDTIKITVYTTEGLQVSRTWLP
jgi:hypothetical protein